MSLGNIKSLNPASILPLSKPSYSIRLHGPLLFPLQEPKLKDKEMGGKEGGGGGKGKKVRNEGKHPKVLS